MFYLHVLWDNPATMKNVMLTPFFSPTPPKPLVEKKNEGNKRLLMRYTGDSDWLRITWFAFIYVYSVGTMVTGNRINNRSAAKKKSFAYFKTIYKILSWYTIFFNSSFHLTYHFKIANTTVIVLDTKFWNNYTCILNMRWRSCLRQI